MPAPTDLVTLSHGRGRLRPEPAASIARIDAALGRPVDINSAYRDWNTQMRLYLEYKAGKGPLALHPDKSWHCKGMAVDTDDNPTRKPALRSLWEDNGWRYVVPSESWHAQYYPHLDKHKGKPAGDGSQPFPIPPKPEPEDDTEDDMKTNNSGITYLNAAGENTRAVVNTSSGYFHAWTDNAVKISDIGAAFGIETWAPVTLGYAMGVQNVCKEMRGS